MKKIFLTFSLIASGMIFANSPIVNENQLSEKDIKIDHKINEAKSDFAPDRTYSGFAAYDTSCCGTCFTYGTYEEWDLGNGQYIQKFTTASQATLSTMVLPSCTGGGSYLA